jgi:hypothetical protein
MSDVKHAHIVTYIPQPDGRTIIQADTYHEQPATMKQQIMQHKETSREMFMVDLIDLVAPFTKGDASELTLHLQCDAKGDPRRITQIYTTKKEVYPRR